MGYSVLTGEYMLQGCSSFVCYLRKATNCQRDVNCFQFFFKYCRHFSFGKFLYKFSAVNLLLKKKNKKIFNYPTKEDTKNPKQTTKKLWE